MEVALSHQASRTKHSLDLKYSGLVTRPLTGQLHFIMACSEYAGNFMHSVYCMTLIMGS